MRKVTARERESWGAPERRVEGHSRMFENLSLGPPFIPSQSEGAQEAACSCFLLSDHLGRQVSRQQEAHPGGEGQEPNPECNNGRTTQMGISSVPPITGLGVFCLQEQQFLKDRNPRQSTEYCVKLREVTFWSKHSYLTIREMCLPVSMTHEI